LAIVFHQINAIKNHISAWPVQMRFYLKIISLVFIIFSCLYFLVAHYIGFHIEGSSQEISYFHPALISLFLICYLFLCACIYFIILRYFKGYLKIILSLKEDNFLEADKQIAHVYPIELRPFIQEIKELRQSNLSISDKAKTHLGNLAHGLKTPLAVLFALKYDEDKQYYLAKVAEQARIMQAQIDHHLQRARLLGRARSKTNRTALTTLSYKMVRTLQKLYPEIEISHIFPAHEVEIAIEKQDLEEVLGNLLDNACKYAKSKISFVIKLDSISNVKKVEIEIEDDGAGLNEEQKGQALKRGVRLDEAKPGSGLGLSIVTEIIDLYDGTIILKDSSLNGLKVTLILPQS